MKINIDQEVVFEKLRIIILRSKSLATQSAKRSIFCGGRQKRFFRSIDFRRNKFDIPGRVVSIEYDPNRTSLIAQINYTDGEKRYILAPLCFEIGVEVVSVKKK